VTKSVSIKFKIWIFAAFCAGQLCLCTAHAGSAPSASAQDEIAHLLNTVEKSQCEFLRNGQWYDSTRARAHLKRKYDYLLRRGLVATSEEFIERAASVSSISGKPYQIRCNAQAPIPSGRWLDDRLRAYRESRIAAQKR
jgi:hypothetical protein